MAPSTGLRSGSDTRRSESFVEILRWPAEAGRRRVALETGHACLWLLAQGELPPELGPREDWVREPSTDQEIEHRIHQLAGRPSPGRPLEPGEIHVDEDGILERWGEWVTVPPIEAQILNRLGRSPERVVTRRELSEIVWCGDHRSARALDSRIHTLRGRLTPLHLTIHTIRGRGYLLAAQMPSPPSPSAIEPAPARSIQWSNS